MQAVSVRLAYDHHIHRFSLLRSPESSAPLTLAILCDALVQHLDLPCKAVELTNSDNAPLELLYLSEGGKYLPLNDDATVQRLIDLNPSSPLNLRLRPPRPPSTMDNTAVDDDGDGDAVEDIPNPVQPVAKPRANTSTCLRIYHYLVKNASSTVSDALDHLSDTLEKHPDDAAKLRENRHEVTYLCASFLHHLHKRLEDYRVTKALYRQLISRWDVIAEKIGISTETNKVIHATIRVVVNCRFSVALVRNKYTELMPEDVPAPPISKTSDAPMTTPSQDDAHSQSISQSRNSLQQEQQAQQNTRIRLPRRPLKYYFTHFDRMVSASADNVQSFYMRLIRYEKRLQKKGMKFPEWTTSLCRSIERTIFHISRFHIVAVPESEDDHLHIKGRAVAALSKSVTRKMVRVGFPEKFALRSGEFAELMASDDGVVAVVAAWSKKKSKRLAATSIVPTRYIRGGDGGGMNGNGMVIGGSGGSVGDGGSGKVNGNSNSSNAAIRRNNSLGSGKGSAKLSRNLSAGSGDVRGSRVTEASGGSRNSWSVRDGMVQSASRSPSNSRPQSRPASVRSGGGGSAAGVGSSSGGVIRRPPINSQDSPKSLADDEFGFRMDLDPNPFGLPRASNSNMASGRPPPPGNMSRDRPPVMMSDGNGRRPEMGAVNGSNGGRGGSGMNGTYAVNTLDRNNINNMRDDILDGDFEFDDDGDDDDDEDDDVLDISFDDRLKAIRRDFGDDIDFDDDDDEDVSAGPFGGGGESDDTRQSQWARVNMDKNSQGNSFSGTQIGGVRQKSEPSRLQPPKMHPARRQGAYRQMMASTSPARRERQTSPRPPHHDGHSVELSGTASGRGASSTGYGRGIGSTTGGSGGNLPGRGSGRGRASGWSVGSEVRGVSSHASETRTVGFGTGTENGSGVAARSTSTRRKLGLNGLDDTFEDDIDYVDDDANMSNVIGNRTYVFGAQKQQQLADGGDETNGDFDGLPDDDDADSFDTNMTIHSDVLNGGVAFGGVPASAPTVAQGEYEPAGGLGFGFHQQKKQAFHDPLSTTPTSDRHVNGWASQSAYTENTLDGTFEGATGAGRMRASGVDPASFKRRGVTPLASAAGAEAVPNGRISGSNVRNSRPIRS